VCDHRQNPPVGYREVAVVGFFIVLGMFTGEYWCEDRSPWWGPPEDPNSTCGGLSWARDHPGEFPDYAEVARQEGIEPSVFGSLQRPWSSWRKLGDWTRYFHRQESLVD
jgi:hypothetical protein